MKNPTYIVLSLAAALAVISATSFTLNNACAAAADSSASSRPLPEIKAPGMPPMCAWLPAGHPRAAILAVHGLGLHMGSYAGLGQRLSRDGIALYSLDVRGFGSFYLKGQPQIDFPNTLTDIGAAADFIKRRHPGLPVFILGESMGGAIALQAASQYPDKFTGLICSVPSGDRFGDLNADLHLVFRVMTGGFKERFDVGTSVIKYATKDDAHRQQWANDPRARKEFSAGELLTFQKFMNKNSDAARALQQMPVLFIQGMNDKLVRPSGTWDVYDHLTTPNRKLVFSKSAEHLIFENAQFNDQDMNYVLSWVSQASHPDVSQVPVVPPNPPTPPTKEDEQLASNSNALAAIEQAANAPSVIKSTSNLTYWIELKRNGQTFRCNNKTQFQSGDEIRFHMRTGVDGFAYILMQQGTAGGRAVLFPEVHTGSDNTIASGRDCAIPTRTYLRFDQTPGVEKVSLIFSKRPIDINKVLQDPNTITAFVSPDRSGAKDLVPTRMQLSWDDPSPVLMPSFEQDSMLASHSSMVRVGCRDNDTVALDIALEHR